MSNLADIVINLRYTKGVPAEYFRYHGEPMPSSYAMAWCMLATGVYRIFSREDLKEFLFRLPVTLNSLGLVETWLLKDRLMNYRVKGKDYTLCLEDVIMHFGLEVIDSYSNMTDREDYLKNVGGGIFNSMLTGHLADFSVIEPETDEDGSKIISGKKHAPEITPELIAKAEFFASDLMKFIPEETFTDRNPLIAEKEKEIEERRERKRNMPVFDIKKIPKRIIRECLEIMFVEEYVDRLLKDPELFEKEARPLIYLGWLLANDMMEYNDEMGIVEKEGVELDYSDYELPGGGSNLNLTVMDYNLRDLGPLLKGLLMEKSTG